LERFHYIQPDTLFITEKPFMMSDCEKSPELCLLKFVFVTHNFTGNEQNW